MLYNLNKKLRRKKHTHTHTHIIRTDFGCNLLRSASKLKSCVMDYWWIILVFHDRGFFFPNIFCWFLCVENRDEVLSVNRF
jgi:hypothetical protein